MGFDLLGKVEPVIPINITEARDIRDKRKAELAEEEKLNSCPLIRMKTMEYIIGAAYAQQYVNEQFYIQIRRVAQEGKSEYTSNIGGGTTGWTALQSKCYLEGLLDGCIGILRRQGFDFGGTINKNEYGTYYLLMTAKW